MKHKDTILNKVLNKEWKSTNKIRTEAQDLAKKCINWDSVHHILTDLFEEKKVKRLKTDGRTLWKKK